MFLPASYTVSKSSNNNENSTHITKYVQYAGALPASIPHYKHANECYRKNNKNDVKK